MEDRRAFLIRTLALAAILPGVALARGAGMAAGGPGDETGGGLPLPGAAERAALDVRPLGNGCFLVSGWILTAADLGALGHAL